MGGAPNPWQRGIALVGLNVCRRKHVPLSAVELIELIRVLANGIADASDLLELPLPLRDAVGRLLFLQALQNSLVFERNPQELLLALVPVEALFRDLVGLEDIRLVALHDVGHLLQQNAVLSLNLGVSA